MKNPGRTCRRSSRKYLADTVIVPTVPVGMQPGTLRVPFESWNAERPLRHSHAERGNDQAVATTQPESNPAKSPT
ncbi:hypothetical protein PFAS1_04095 [Pseudomonas frederiksbergensis]|nr:hypothetical protein PFAS1_04095 [Pseudomonas frederiksbergensis]